MSRHSPDLLAAHRVGDLIQARNPHHPRAGQWARVTVFLDGPGPPSWLVTFTGNQTAIWPVTDA